VVDQQLAGDVEQPRAGIFDVAEGSPLLNSLEKNLLQQVVGLGRAAALRLRKARSSALCWRHARWWHR